MLQQYQNYLKNNKELVSLVVFSLVVRAAYLLVQLPVWWDAYVYVGMGKYIFSSGQLGIWESFRPLVHPLILGFFWKIGIDPLVAAKVLDVLFSLGSIVCVYYIGIRIYGKMVGLLSGILLSITPVFLLFTGMALTEPLAIFLALLGLLLYLQAQKNIHVAAAGALLGLSFLTKFPMGIFFGCTLLVALSNKKIKEAAYLGAGFTLAVSPYFLYNYIQYNLTFEPLFAAQEIVTTATWSYGSGYLYYLTHFFVPNIPYLLFFVYIYYLIKEKRYNHESEALVSLIAFCGLLYFTLLVPRKEVRYLVIVVPLLALMASFAWQRLYLFLSKQESTLIKPKALAILSIVSLVLMLPLFIFVPEDSTEQDIRLLLNEHAIAGTILTTDPVFVYLTDQRVITLSSQFSYAPIIYNATRKEGYALLYIDDCQLVCDPSDMICLEQKEAFLELVKSENTLIATKKWKDSFHWESSVNDTVIVETIADSMQKAKNCSIYFYIPAPNSTQKG